MSPLTQPLSDDERRKVREWREQGMVPFCGTWTPDKMLFANEPSFEPFEIDWLAINRGSAA